MERQNAAYRELRFPRVTQHRQLLQPLIWNHVAVQIEPYSQQLRIPVRAIEHTHIAAARDAV